MSEVTPEQLDAIRPHAAYTAKRMDWVLALFAFAIVVVFVGPPMAWYSWLMFGLIGAISVACGVVRWQIWRVFRI